MCGICGILSFNKAGGFTSNIKAMNAALAHRGPNADGTWLNDDIILGHRRLSIIDLSPAGNQPMVSSDQRYILAFNGEIYNFRELRGKLPDYPFKTNSDSEVILAAYCKWGKNCVSHFNGMFAFAIWDDFEKELFLVRDRLGIKPLYYFMDEEKLIFSSEIRSIIASDLVKRRIDRKSLVDYVRYQTVHAPGTIIEGVKMLMPGQYIIVRSSTSGNKNYNFEASRPEAQNETSETLLSSAFQTVKSGYYWQLGKSFSSSLTPHGKSKKQIHGDILELLTHSVERRLIADVPFGAFLSGGIDSSIVVGLMASVLNQKINTFSVTFSERKYSESPYSQLIANRFHTNHTEIHLSPEDFLQMLPNALNSMDHPSGDGPNTWVVSKVTKEAGITMALSGLGGDELFAGYDIFKRLNYLYKLRGIAKLPIFIRAGIPGWLLNLAKPSASMVKINELLNLPTWGLVDTYPLSRQILPDRKIEKLLLDTDLSLNAVEAIVKEISYRMQPGHLLSSISCAEISTYMQNVLLRDTDQMSMAHALEVRVPFLDYSLVEYVLQVQDNMKFPHTPKQLLVESVDPLLPRDFAQRRKMGFTLPWDHWMRNELKSFCENQIQSLSKHDYFNSCGLMQIWKRFLNKDPLITWSRIWTLVALGDWLTNNNID
jgi:asparagine synthase (glutamine-hydrolysing)